MHRYLHPIIIEEHMQKRFIDYYVILTSYWVSGLSTGGMVILLSVLYTKERVEKN